MAPFWHFLLSYCDIALEEEKEEVIITIGNLERQAQLAVAWHWLRAPSAAAIVEMFGELTDLHFTWDVSGAARTEHD